MSGIPSTLQPLVNRIREGEGSFCNPTKLGMASEDRAMLHQELLGKGYNPSEADALIREACDD